MALAEDEDFLSVAALQSETIKTVTAEESTGLTFKGKKFQVLGQGACDIFEAEIASGDSLVISSLDGTAIKSVDINFGVCKVTVKKGTPKGLYKIKIKVTAAGNKNYKSRSKTVTCKVKVV